MTRAEGKEATSVSVQIWDWPTRLAHWLLVALVFFSWGSAEYHHMDWHRYSGYTVLGVVLFRLYWGLVGSDTARFSKFVKGPRSIAAYLKSDSAEKKLGHNPLGALSVLALLLFLFMQVGLGLFAVDTDGLESGPLSNLVSFETGRILAHRHAFVFNLLLGLIALHVAAIFFYLLVKRDNLVRPMIVGKKTMPIDVSAVTVDAPILRVVVGVVLATAVVWFVVR